MNTRLLYLKLKLKRLHCQIADEVYENFGYGPNTEYFNQLVDCRDILLEELRRDYPRDYYEYINEDRSSNIEVKIVYCEDEDLLYKDETKADM
jgi:hypothetical protein